MGSLEKREKVGEEVWNASWCETKDDSSVAIAMFETFMVSAGVVIGLVVNSMKRMKIQKLWI